MTTTTTITHYVLPPNTTTTTTTSTTHYHYYNHYYQIPLPLLPPLPLPLALLLFPPLPQPLLLFRPLQCTTTTTNTTISTTIYHYHFHPLSLPLPPLPVECIGSTATTATVTTTNTTWPAIEFKLAWNLWVPAFLPPPLHHQSVSLPRLWQVDQVMFTPGFKGNSIQEIVDVFTFQAKKNFFLLRATTSLKYVGKLSHGEWNIRSVTEGSMRNDEKGKMNGEDTESSSHLPSFSLPSPLMFPSSVLKSLLVMYLWDITLTHSPPCIQSCSPEVWTSSRSAGNH